ncbi:MAG TPA: MFS transporter [Streptosporangiaceae bacterium]
MAIATEIPRLRGGTPAFRRFNLAMFAAGLATFALLYAPQPVLPQIGGAFGLTPVGASLTVAAATAALAVAVIPLASVSEVVGRKPVMVTGVAVAAVLGVAAAAAPGLGWMLAARAVQGVALAGLPAAAMAHVTEEVHGSATGRAMGLYIAGNSVGGMAGRLLVGGVTDVAGWRWGMASVGVFSVLCALVFAALLPRPVAFQPRPARWRALAAGVVGHLRSVRLLRLYLTGFALMGGMVTVYNYLGYRLAAPPFGLSAAAVGLIFLCYLAGTVSSTAAGRVSDRLGRRPIATASAALALAGLAVTLIPNLVAVIAGLLLFTAGFFGCHTIASGWVGRIATAGRAQASALYMLAYYLGSSVAGSAGGEAYVRTGWPGTVIFVGVLLLVAALAVRITTRRKE